jgi:hypothetical protein
MNQIRNFEIALSFAAALAFITAPARSDTWDKKTTVKFSQTIEVPGAVLQPGTYVMKLVDLSSQRHVVQFMNERENRVYAAAMAIPAYRDRVTDYTVIGFYEAPAGKPEAMKNWFYPGDNYGQEFLYPKGRGGTRLAAATTTAPADTSLNSSSETNASPALTSEAATSALASTEAVTPRAPAREPVEVAQASPPAQESEPVTVAQNQPAQPVTNSSAPAEPALPRTASNLPEIAALGSLALAGAAAVRKFRRGMS